MADDAALGDFVEFVHKEDGPCKLHVGLAVRIRMWRPVADGSIKLHAIRVQMEHDRSFHLAGMPHSAKLLFPHLAQRFCRETPVGSEDKAWLWCFLFKRAQRCPERRVVA